VNFPRREWRTREVAHGAVTAHETADFGDAEVRHRRRATRVKQDVPGREISVRDVAGMSMRNSHGQGAADSLPERRPVESRLCGLPPDQIGIHPFEDDLALAVGGDAGAMHPHDVGVPQLGE
jgi:hypothetical protein